jgi:hypothetical protein
MENLMQRTGKIPGLDLSEWDAWGWYGQYSCEAFIAALTKNYVCDEQFYPQYGKRSQDCITNRYVKVATAIYIDDNPDAMRDALARGSMVYIGMATPNDMLKCKPVISPTTTAANGGHALLINGYFTEGAETLAIIKNSWGADCGDGGYQYFPLSLCRKSGFYCVAWEIQGVNIKTAPAPTPTVKPTPVVTPTPTPLPTKRVCTKYTGMWWWKKCIEWKTVVIKDGASESDE